jgi:hypothetical protein
MKREIAIVVGFLVFFALLAWGIIAFAGTASLTWDVYPQNADFKEIRVYRGSGTLCGSGVVPLQPLMTRVAPFVQVVIPKAVPPAITPNVFTDTNAPDTIGMLCYEITAVDVIPPVLVGGTPTTLESKRSNRAIKFVESPVIVPDHLEVAP